MKALKRYRLLGDDFLKKACARKGRHNPPTACAFNGENATLMRNTAEFVECAQKMKGRLPKRLQDALKKLDYGFKE